MIVMGIDVGSTTTKAVLVDENKAVKATCVTPTGIRPEHAISKVLTVCCENSGILPGDIRYCVSTGYGRELVSYKDEQVTEITCHAKGLHAIFPEARTVIDIGGQDSKAIAIDEKGHITSFAMNDQCAAGTGRFVEVMARIMEIDIQEMGKLSLESKEPVLISSVCTVFAESEVISQVSRGVNPIDIMAGINKAIAKRIKALLGRIRYLPPIAMTGGLAHNIGVVKALEEITQTEFLIPEHPQLVGALGAAFIAFDKCVQNTTNNYF